MENRDIKTEPDIVELLVAHRHVSEAQGERFRRFSQKWEVTAYEALLETGVFSEPNLADILAEALGLDRIHRVQDLEFSPQALDALSYDEAKKRVWLPAGEPEGAEKTLELVVADPTETHEIRSFEQGLGWELRLAVGQRSDIVGYIDEVYPLKEQLPDTVGRTP